MRDGYTLAGAVLIDTHAHGVTPEIQLLQNVDNRGLSNPAVTSEKWHCRAKVVGHVYLHQTQAGVCRTV